MNQKTINNIVIKNKALINDIANKVNDVSKIYITDVEPPYPKKGDIWFVMSEGYSEEPENPEEPDDSTPVQDYYFRFDASKLNLTNNASVTTWSDLSENGNDLTASETAPVYMVSGLNNLPTVKFTSSPLQKEGLTLDNVDSATVFMVGQLDAAASSTFLNIGTIGSDDSYARRFNIKYSNSSTSIKAVINGNNNGPTGPNISVSEPFLFTGVYNKVKNQAYKNGVFNSEFAYTSDIGSHGALSIGKSLYTSGYELLTGCISEIIYFSRALTTNELDQMHTYLLEKWGLS